MKITRQTVADKVRAYLRHELPLAGLVDWAEQAMANGEFDEQDFQNIRDAVAKLGLADVKAFGLTWEDCESLLNRLGYSVQVDVIGA